MESLASLSLVHTNVYKIINNYKLNLKKKVPIPDLYYSVKQIRRIFVTTIHQQKLCELLTVILIAEPTNT
jgi:hypothetical protein